MKLAAKDAILRIATQRAGNVEKWVLFGSLSGRMAEEVAVSWKNTRCERNGRECVIDLTEVTSVDERGEQVLMEMMRKGVRFVVRGLYLRTLLETLGERCKQEE